MNLTLEYESFQDFASKLWPSLSEEGMWVRSKNPAAVGELVDFDVMLADGFRLFHGTGQVIDVGPGPAGGTGGEGMTLRFSQLDQPSRNLVRKVVSKHIGEGGKLFVLSTPATKVEVVGNDEAQGSAGGSEQGGMGPEDLVAPFAGLETSTPWSADAEPELTSFLRPSGRGVDLAKAAHEEQDEVVFALPERPAGEPSLWAFEEEGDAVPSARSGEGDDTSSADALEAPVPPPGNAPEDGSAEEEALSQTREFELGLAETQRVDPEDLVEPGQRGLPLGDEAKTFSPRPSTVIPPSPAEFGVDTAGVDDEPSTDDFYPHGTSPSSGRLGWPWVVVGGLVIGAGLYALWQMETPLSGFFGKGGKAVQSASVGLDSATSARADLTAGEAGNDTAIEVVGEAPGSEDVREGEAVGRAEGYSDALQTPPNSADTSSAQTARQPTVGVDDDLAQDAPPAPAATATRAEAAATPVSGDPSAGTVAVAELAPLSLQRITWRAAEGDTVIRLALSGPLTRDRFETQRVTQGSPRVVLKVLGAAGDVPRGPVAIGSDHVQQLRFGVHDVGGVRQIHAVADLEEESVQMVGQVVITDGAVELRFGRP